MNTPPLRSPLTRDTCVAWATVLSPDSRGALDQGPQRQSSAALHKGPQQKFCPNFCPRGGALTCLSRPETTADARTERGGRAPQTSKTGGCRFESCRPCWKRSAPTLAAFPASLRLSAIRWSAPGSAALRLQSRGGRRAPVDVALRRNYGRSHACGGDSSCCCPRSVPTQTPCSTASADGSHRSSGCTWSGSCQRSRSGSNVSGSKSPARSA